MKKGELFTYELKFPDVGMYWYHPHVREDEQQEIGMYGNILVIPSDSDFADFDDDIAIILDDIRLEADGTITPFAG